MNGEKLERGQSLTSRNGAYTLTLQDDGNLVFGAGGEAVWATGTNGQDVERLEMQKDGNCVLYTSDRPVWHTDTKGAKDVRLLLQDDRNLVLYGFDGPAWASNTQTNEPPPAPAAEVPAAEVVPAAAEEPGLRRRSPNRRPRRRLRGHTRWSPATPCGRSRSASTATAANTR
jgi:hypothetical protein